MPEQITRLAQLRIAQRPRIKQYRPKPPLLIARSHGLLRDPRQHKTKLLAIPRHATHLSAMHRSDRDRLAIDQQPGADIQRRGLRHASTRELADTQLSSPIG